MANPKVFGIYGESNSGKTHIIEELIKNLTQRGFRVGTFKISDKLIDIDTPKKDTWRHYKAGSSVVAFQTTNETSFLHIKDLSETDVIDVLKNILKLDFIVVEGAKDKDIYKIKIGESIKTRENTIKIFECRPNVKKVIGFIEREIIKDR